MEVLLTRSKKLNGIIRISLKKSDYQEQVELQLKAYKRKAKMPGFREGKIPSGLIKKMYWKTALIDEINKLLQKTLLEYLQKEQLNLLGNPLPKESQIIDWDNDEDFTFDYEVGFAPEIKIQIKSKQKLNEYKIIADDHYVGRIIKDLSTRYGQFSEPKKISHQDRVFARFTEIDVKGFIKESGIMKENYFSVSSIKKKFQDLFIGLKKNHELTVNILEIFSDKQTITHLLNITEEQISNLSSNFKINVLNISRVNPASINKDLFDKIYGKDSIKTEKEFQIKIKEEAEKTFQKDSDIKFLNDSREYLLNNHTIDLPNSFLKKWLLSVNEKKASKEQIEAEYPNYIDGLKLQLMEKEIMKENNIKIKQEEIDLCAQQMIRSQMAQYGHPNPSQDEVDKLVEKISEKEEERNKIIDYVRSQKLCAFYKGVFKINKKKVTFEEFSKLISKK